MRVGVLNAALETLYWSMPIQSVSDVTKGALAWPLQEWEWEVTWNLPKDMTPIEIGGGGHKMTATKASRLEDMERVETFW